MPFVVTDACIRCLYTNCVEVCPVDCFFCGEVMLVISPDKCIDCGACAPQCPVSAIVPDTDPLADKWLPINAEFSATWPSITHKREHPPDADAYRDQPSKFERYFSSAPDAQEKF
ncbi:ferredoxin FdxA [Pollutimonas bauzanensis]|uniref:Ferredoxin n=1 Tax=Pollutimonas bauzanensis TaxID=658167 RepID=A0A1M5UMP3_9BURK|nr:ferredoxin FdxA [Pollutimonas bauzanensis]SHH64138.1 ferredoxin [Pollutimonas bauzanensis]